MTIDIDEFFLKYIESLIASSEMNGYSKTNIDLSLNLQFISNSSFNINFFTLR